MEKSSLKVSQKIESEVFEYKKKTIEMMDVVKLMYFRDILKEEHPEDFNKRLDKIIAKYEKEIDGLNDYEEIFKLVYEINLVFGELETIGNKPIKQVLDAKKLQIDTRSQKKAMKTYTKYMKDYYKKTYKTSQKEYVDTKQYLKKKVNKFDKIEKVVRYKNGAYYDVATYNSMVENCNKTNSGLNATLEASEKLGFDLVYIPPHAFSCPLCMEYQGKIYSLTGATPGYPILEVGIDKTELFHPNCKHIVEKYRGQKESDYYNTLEWQQAYKDRQKLGALRLKRGRMANDKKVYEMLGDQEQVDKINSKLSKVNQEIRKYNDLLKLNKAKIIANE